MTHAEFMEKFAKKDARRRDTIELAYILSKDAHRSHERKGGERYFEHPRRVALNLLEAGVDDYILTAAALLHDTVEDTQYITVPKLERWFGRPVSDIVDKLTKRPGENQRTYYARLALSDEAVVVKGCDRLDNLRSLKGTEDEFIRKQILGTREHVLPMLQKTADLTVTEGSSYVTFGARTLVALIEKEMRKAERLITDLERCNSMGKNTCPNMKRKDKFFCDSCEKDYKDDPEAFK